jgi:hypothetical protein
VLEGIELGERIDETTRDGAADGLKCLVYRPDEFKLGTQSGEVRL